MAMEIISHLHLHTLRARLLVLVFIAVLPALGLIFYTARDQRQMAENHARQDLLRLAHLVKNEHQLLLEGTRQLLTVLSQVPAVRNHDVAACNALMQTVAKDQPQYVGLGAVTPGGDRFCGGNFAEAGPVNIADRLWFQRTIKTLEFTIGHYQIGRLARRAVFPLAYPSVDETGNLRAVVLAVLSLEWLKMRVEASAPADSSVTIVDEKGLVLAHHPDGEQWVGRSVDGTSLDQALRTALDGLQEVEGIDGNRRLMVLSTLTGSDGSGVVRLVVGTPTDRVFAEADRVLRRNLLWLTLVSLAIFAAAWFGGNVFVLRHVNSVLGAARRLAEGDLKARTGLEYDTGELGRLAQTFDAMASSLEARALEARRAESKARENERLAAIGATVASITHEIGNPLNGMYSMVQFLELQLSEPGRTSHDMLRSHLELLKEEIERLRSLLQDLRFVVRPSELNLKPVILNELFSELLAIERHQFDQRAVHVQLEVPDFLPAVMADREKLKQALLNLCKNALDAMPQGGKLVLRAFLVEDAVVIEVKDTGAGIPAQINIFEPFSTTKQHGLGLGLTIVRQIAVAHGGHVSYSSAPNEGTVFQISMPLEPSFAQQSPSLAATAHR